MKFKFDPVKIACVTTWNPTKEKIKSNRLSLYLWSKEDFENLADKIDFFFSPFNWKMQAKTTVYVGVYSATHINEPVAFDIRVREYMPFDTYNENQKIQSAIFEEALEGTDAHATSFKERQETDVHDDKCFTYGEVLLP